jgi:hypothetical protein
MYSIPRNPVGMIHYAFRAMGQNRVSIERLCFFLSFELGLMPPSKAQIIVNNLSEKGVLIIDDDWVTISPDAALDSSASSPSLSDLLHHFVSSSRLSRAVGIEDSAIEIKILSKTPLRIKAVVHGTRDYQLSLDEELRIIGHNCPDWRKVSVIRRFCKHVTKLFLSLEEDEAIRLLLSMQRDPWKFEEI